MRCPTAAAPSGNDPAVERGSAARVVLVFGPPIDASVTTPASASTAAAIASA